MQRYWAQFTPEERAKEMKRRAKLSLRKGNKGFPAFTGKKGSAVQAKGKYPSEAFRQIYYARARAKKQGLPLPPLPRQGAPMTREQKREKDRLRQQRKRDAIKKAAQAKARKAGAAVKQALDGMKTKPSPPGAGTNRKILTAEERQAKQRVYQQRNTAKAKGLPLPPLPPQIHTAAA